MLPQFDEYRKFNLLVGYRTDLWCLCGKQQRIVPVEPGYFGVSNGGFDEAWPKVNAAKAGLGEILGTTDDIDCDEVIHRGFAVMADRRIAEDVRLPDTGIGIESERGLSPIFIDLPAENYGTLCTGVVVLDADGKLTFAERSHVRGSLPRDVQFEFQL